MGSFISSHNNKYILVVVDQVSKWVEATALSTNDSKGVVNFLKKHIFTRFGIPRVIISDKGFQVRNHRFEVLLTKYGAKYKGAFAYHPQTSGQVEVSNMELKKNC